MKQSILVLLTVISTFISPVPVFAATVNLVSFGSVWKYLDNGSDQGTAWRAPGFNDGAWASGPAQLGYGDGDEATIVSFGPDSNNKFITTYFRRTFNVSNVSSYTNLVVQLLRDDAGVVYLNGTEIFRSPNLPAPPTAITSGTLATGLAVENFLDVAQVNGALGLLVNGANTLAVEIHQQATNSSDISFDLELVAVDTVANNVAPTVTLTAPANNATFRAPTNIVLQATGSDTDGSVTKVEFFRDGVKIGEDATPPNPFTFNWTNAFVGTFQLTAVATDNGGLTGVSSPVTVHFDGLAPATLIGTGSIWKYLDTGVNLAGSPWNTVGYDDTAWLSGPAQLGYGDGDEATVVGFGPDSNNKYTTTYFRRIINVPDPSPYTFLVVRLMRDDGAVVYLNGTEIFRSNMPGGPVDGTTLASTSVGGTDESAFFTNTAPANLLLSGNNVVAVEVHQSAGNSSDISFELELIGNTGAIINNPPSVAITSPSPGATFTEPANATINVAASDTDGSVSKVEFFVNGTKIGEDTSAPFSMGWSGAGMGTYNLTAVATDNLGGSATSSVVTVTVQASTAPTLAGKTPAPGTLNSLTQISVQFSEPVDGVDAADLLVNNVPAASVTGSNANYTFTFPQPAEGVVGVRFASNAGIVNRESPPKPFDVTAPAASWSYTLVDNQAPTVVKVDPLPGATLPELPDISVTFNEAVAGVNASDLRVNGVGATSLQGAGAGPYVFHFQQPTNGNPLTLNLAWTNTHGIHDVAAAQNAFVGSPWSYTLNTNAVETDIVINEIMYHPFHNQAAYIPEPVNEEYIELFNRGTTPVNLTGWRIKGGVDFRFTNVTMNPGTYLVVTPSVSAFTSKYGAGNGPVVGGWIGRLSNNDDDITLETALGQNVDSVHYADSGDWGFRRILPDSTAGLPSWEWTTDADGGGRSLELINPRMPNQYGQNWTTNLTGNGTPGRVNSQFSTNAAPFILDLVHSPAIPTSIDPVLITARVLDEQPAGVTVTLFWRTTTNNFTTPNSFTQVTMRDDGLSGDGLAGDQVYGASVPAQPAGTVVEFYVRATDAGARARTWPAPTDASGTQGANALYQVDDSSYTGLQPIYRIIMTPDEDARLKELNQTAAGSDARMNATLVTVDGSETVIRYLADVRHRGAGSRGAEPPNLRIGVPRDHRWKGVAAFNLNTLYTHSQLAGSILSRLAGLTSEEAIAVQVRVNGTNFARVGLPQFGSYIHLEARDNDWAANHFPLDPKGNVYTCTRPNGGLTPINPPTPANLEGNGYQKDSNKNDDDYSDIANLLDVINNTPDAQFPAAARQTIKMDVYLRYIAVLSLLGYGETAIGSDGAPDDYTLYRGLTDTHLYFVPHDHDTDMGEGDSSRQTPFNSIFRAADGNNAMNRLLRNPEFVPFYYKELKHQLETTFTPGNVARTLDQAYLNFPVASATITAMKDWFTNRYANVWSQIPTNLTITPPALSLQNGYYRTTVPSVSLGGSANAIDTRYVKVNGQFAGWTAWQGVWSASVNLQPGINRVVVRSTDGAGVTLQEATIDIWYDDGTVTNVSGALTGSPVWTAANGPYVVTAATTVPSGVTLTIQPGTSVFFAPGATLTVSGTGRLLAEGTESQHIRLTRQPGGANWGSLDFIGASAESRVAYADFEFCGGTTVGGHNAQVHANNSVVFFDHLTFASTPVVEFISFDNSSFIVQNSIFPTYPGPTGPESLHGVNGIPAAGYGIIRDNYFGHTWGFNDTIDFTGGNRPGAILQILNNVFDGATDDHLDLDSTDAWIEGNIFLHAHRDPTRTDDARDTASAISGGVDFAGVYSEWTVINNLFYDVDHATLNKGGGRFIFQNNTLVHVAKEWGAGLVGDIAAFNFTDDGVALPDPSVGAGAYIAGNIIWDTPLLVANYNPANHTVIFNNNLLPLAWSGPGGSNVVGNPGLNLALITVPTNADWRTVQAAFKPQPGSPAIGTGLGGFDKGGLNPRGLLIFGEPPAVTPLTTATLTVAPGGTFNWGTVVPPYVWGYTHYKWKLDNGAWSAETSITTSPTISLSGLGNGPHTVYVSGKNDAGAYQDDPFVYPPTAGIPAHVTASRTWVVNTSASALRLNEVLARNDAAVPVGAGRFPDLIELYNAGTTTISLTGLGLTDEPDNPFKFVFPAGASLGAGQYLTLFADSETTPAGVHLGFSLKQEGDEVVLTAADGRILDTVSFGLQVPDLSIGRASDGNWALCRPTFGAANITVAPGNSRTLKINEWLASGVVPFPDDFIELFNPDPLPVSLGELFLTDNPVNAPFLHDIAPLSFIPGGGFAVFIADGEAGDGPNHVNFKLRAEQGMIGLMAANGAPIDVVVYGPQTTDISMGRQPNGAPNFGFFSPPSPGAPNPGVVGSNAVVVINEVLAQNTQKREPDGSTPDWVEFYNPTPSAIDMADMSLTDDLTIPRRFVFPAGSTIPSLGFRTIRCDSAIPIGPTNAGFGLKASGQALYLYDKLANGGSQISAVSFGVQATDYSIGRVPNGSGNWVLCVESIGSGNSAVVLGNAANLKVNEWLANPSSGKDDWFEIYNPNAQPVALGGLYLSDSLGSPATRRKHLIPPLSFIGVGGWAYQRFVADNNTLNNPDHVSFKLDGTVGEEVGISTANGTLIDGIGFGPQAEDVSEGRLPDGTATIVRFPGTDSPGDPNYLLLTNVVINEVLTHTDLPLEDAIELRNLTGASVNISGWYLSDAKHDLKKYRIPNGTSIAGNGFRVFYEYQFNDTNSAFAFSLSSAKGDEVYLGQANAGGDLTGYRAQVSFGAAENGVSFGRFVTSVGADFTAMSARSFGVDNPDAVTDFRNGSGRTNPYPKVGPIVISEIMYHPLDLSGTNDTALDEFIELRNIGSQSVALYDPSFPANVWKLKDAVSFDFPPNTVMPAGGYLLVVSFDPDDTTLLNAFRAKYNVLVSTPVVGPYGGKLDNKSDSVELYKPDAPQIPPSPDVGYVPYILEDKVKYFDSAPWPAGADGTGLSLQKVSIEEYGNDPVNWTAATPTPGPQGSADADGDGMDDAWELAFFGTLARNGSGDFDGDGSTDLAEFLAGTDPTSSTSVLRLSVARAAPTVLSFGAVANKTYAVEYKNALNAASWTLLQNVPAGAARIVQVTDPAPAPAGRFYRVRTP